MTLTDHDNARPPTPSFRVARSMPRRTSHASSVCSRASSSSSSSFSSSSASSSSSNSSFSRYRPSPLAQEEEEQEQEQEQEHEEDEKENAYYLEEEEEEEEDYVTTEEVYVSSCSGIVVGDSAGDNNTYDEAYDPAYYNASQVSTTSGSGTYDSAWFRSIFYEPVDNTESQEITCFLEEDDDGENLEDDGSTGGHYEAIYEVISPAEDEEEDLCSHDGQLEDQQQNINNESFDSNDSDDAYSRLHPQYQESCSQALRGRQESFNSDISSSDNTYSAMAKGDQHLGQQQYGINKIAEAANIGMKRLRRNWSLTKSEVRTGLSRIKKKSTFNVSDVNPKEHTKIISEPNSSTEDKRKWSFKSNFRRKSSPNIGETSMVLANNTQSKKDKETATFYLTLTIETDKKNPGNLSDTSQRTLISDTTKIRRTSDTLPRMKATELENVKCHMLQDLRKYISPSLHEVNNEELINDSSLHLIRRPVSSASMLSAKRSPLSSTYNTCSRPKTAPPAPPIERSFCESEMCNEPEESSKDKLASRLNHLLSHGPTAPPGRRVLRSSDCSSNEQVSPVPALIHPENPSPTGSRTVSVKYASIDMTHLSDDRRSLSSEVGSCITHNIPHSRSSVVSSSSHGSSEGYIRPADLASIPPPLPARQSIQSKTDVRNSWKLSISPITPMPSDIPESDNCSYLDLDDTAIEDEPIYVSSHFADEPLYQFYTRKVLERETLNQGDYSSEDDYEVINDGQAGGSIVKVDQARPSAMELVTPTDGRRTLWCELPEVINSGILNKLNSQERKVQEAMFEVITSEASYLKSLNVLVTHFSHCPEFIPDSPNSVLTRRERHVLFSDILPVKRCSEMFLADLEKRWQESVRIESISDIVLKAASTNFNVYVKYCSNQIYQDRILRQLKDHNPQFLSILGRLESSVVCQSLAMHSFLMLPMQRITRLPLLIDAIFHRLEYGSPQWHECKLALATLTKIVAECNEGARKMERMEEMLIISRQLDFREVKAIPLISASRWLVKKGELTRLTWREHDAKLTFGKRISKHTLYFFLFTDLLVVTKKKSDDQFTVLDHCPRNMVQVLELDGAEKFPGRLLDGHKNLLIMTMLQNHESKTVEMVLSCPLESDRTRWMEAVTPRISENPDERIYEEWDCPQVQGIHSYVGKQPDELSLEVCDVVNVLKKMADGWYQGERLRDGERGWFPGNYTIEIASAHRRAHNLRQRYRLLAISANFLDELKKEKERFEKEEKRKTRRKTLPIKEIVY